MQQVCLHIYLSEQHVFPSPSLDCDILYRNSDGIACDRLCLSKARTVHQYAGEISSHASILTLFAVVTSTVKISLLNKGVVYS